MKVRSQGCEDTYKQHKKMCVYVCVWVSKPKTVVLQKHSYHRDVKKRSKKPKQGRSVKMNSRLPFWFLSEAAIHIACNCGNIFRHIKIPSKQTHTNTHAPIPWRKQPSQSVFCFFILHLSAEIKTHPSVLQKLQE